MAALDRFHCSTKCRGSRGKLPKECQEGEV